MNALKLLLSILLLAPSLALAQLSPKTGTGGSGTGFGPIIGTGGAVVTSNGVNGTYTIDTSSISSPTGGVSAATATNIVTASFTASMTNFVLVSKAGSDTTGARCRLDKPFQTPLAAKNAASSGDTVIVLPGTYTNSAFGVLDRVVGLAKDGVNWYFYPGAEIKVYGDVVDFVGTTNISIFSDTNGPLRCRIMGSGRFYVNVFCDGLTDFGIFNITNAASDVTIEADKIIGISQQTFAFNAIYVRDCSNVVVKANVIEPEQIEPGIDNTPGSYMNAIYWNNGNVSVTAERIGCSIGSAIWANNLLTGNQATNTSLWVKANLIVQYTNGFGLSYSPIFVSATNGSMDYKVYVQAEEIAAGGWGQNVGAVTQVGGKLYLTVQKLGLTKGGSYVIGQYGGTLWAEIQKISTSLNVPAILQGTSNALSLGNITADIREIEDSTNVTTMGMALAGTNVINVDRWMTTRTNFTTTSSGITYFASGLVNGNHGYTFSPGVTIAPIIGAGTNRFQVLDSNRLVVTLIDTNGLFWTTNGADIYQHFRAMLNAGTSGTNLDINGTTTLMYPQSANSGTFQIGAGTAAGRTLIYSKASGAFQLWNGGFLGFQVSGNGTTVVGGTMLNSNAVSIHGFPGQGTNRWQTLNSNLQAVIYVDTNDVLNASNVVILGNAGVSGNLVVTQKISQIGGGTGLDISGAIKFTGPGGSILDSDGDNRIGISAAGDTTIYGAHDGNIGLLIDKDGGLITASNATFLALPGSGSIVAADTGGSLFRTNMTGSGAGGTNFPPIIALSNNTNSTITVGSGVRQSFARVSGTNFTFNFSGTPLNGEDVRLSVSNASSSTVYITNTAGIYDYSVASNVTTFAIAATSACWLHFVSSTNFNNGTARWELVDRHCKEFELAIGGVGLSMVTNGATVKITNNGTGIQQLTNVVITNPGFGDTITYQSGQWVNYPPLYQVFYNVTVISNVNIFVGTNMEQSLALASSNSFGLTFTGTPLPGERFHIAVFNSNQFVNIFMTNNSYNPLVGANQLRYEIRTNSIASFTFVNRTNWNAAGTNRWELDRVVGWQPYDLLVSNNIYMLDQNSGGYVEALNVFGGSVVLGGYNSAGTYTTILSSTGNKLVQWNGSAWTPGSGLISDLGTTSQGWSTAYISNLTLRAGLGDAPAAGKVLKSTTSGGALAYSNIAYSAAQTISGAGNGNTNYLFTLLPYPDLNDFYLGSSNVNIYTVAGSTLGSPLYWNAYITNLSANTWGISFASGTNRWRFSGTLGTNAPSVLTNNTCLMLSGRSDGTNTIVGWTTFSPGL